LSEVMDIMIKTGITEEVAHAFDKFSDVVHRLHEQTHQLDAKFGEL